MKHLVKCSLIFSVICLIQLVSFGKDYMSAPKEIREVLDAPAIPSASISPKGDMMALLTPLNYPPISDLAEPMARLAGLRINPDNNSRADQGYFVSVSIKNINTGKLTEVNFPAGVRLISPRWSADGKYLAVGNMTKSSVELWIVNSANGTAQKLKNIAVNSAYGGFDWAPDQKSLLVATVPANRGAIPKGSNVPDSPSIQESSGKSASLTTYQDLLKSPNDEAVFEYLATSQMARVSVDGKVQKLGPAGIYADAEFSPDGNYIYAARVKRPFSYLFPVYMFGRELEIWDKNGKRIADLGSLPLQDALPEGGVATGPRSIGWIPTESATLMWVEALDGGDPKAKVENRDRLLVKTAPFNAEGKEVLRLRDRYSGRSFFEKGGKYWVYDYDREKQRRRLIETTLADGSKQRVISDLNIRDRYNNPGSPVTKTLPNGKDVIMEHQEGVFMRGNGSTPNGDRPFLRILKPNGETVELFRSSEDAYEFVADVVSPGGDPVFITRRESQSEPPNYFLTRSCLPYKKCDLPSPVKLTDFKDPAPSLRGITKKLVKYKRKDGVDLSFTLYLPPNYKKGTKLPALLWAYPLEYTNASTAGQVSGSTNRFTTIGGYSHLFLLTQGYAILDNATVPIVGDPLTVNDTFIEQLVDGAQAAVDKASEMGVIDRDRVAVGGHSYGAFMTAHLLASSDIFRAGIARSGAYNRTLTPFGFQSERRAFWEAQDIYYKLSPFMKANKIKEPMLMIHGMADNNSGTFPIQSERMYAGIVGNGGTARLVMLPLESHGYRARQSIEHVIWEQIQWMDKYVKNAPAR
ncbi:MAG: prolyl oligopeptidase family serine peptidase [Pyrinomonadaceae bacterium]